MAHNPNAASHFPPDTRIAGIALALVAVLYVAISPLALAEFGLSYNETGGNALEKIHPATMLAVLVLAGSGLYLRNPLSGLLNGLSRQPGTVIFLIMIAMLILHSIAVVSLPFTFFFDTYLGPVLVFFLFKDMRDARAGRLVMLFHALMMINAVIGVIEFATGTRLTPLVLEGQLLDEEWRSSALLGHPLANASLTGAYILTLALGAADDLPRPVAVLSFVLSAAGMVVFGGRAATVILLLMLFALALWRAVQISRGRRFDPRTITTALVAIPLLALALGGLAEAGFFDRFIERFFDDEGSASTRVEMFELLKHLSWYELLLAPDGETITTWKLHYGLDFGIESMWLSFVLNYGLIPGLAFFGSMFLFLRDVARVIRPGGVWVLLFFFAVASTSVSLSTKTSLFAILILMLMVLMRRRETAHDAVEYKENTVFKVQEMAYPAR